MGLVKLTLNSGCKQTFEEKQQKIKECKKKNGKHELLGDGYRMGKRHYFCKNCPYTRSVNI